VILKRVLAAKRLLIAQNQDFVPPSARNKKSVSILIKKKKKVSVTDN